MQIQAIISPLHFKCLQRSFGFWLNSPYSLVVKRQSCKRKVAWGTFCLPFFIFSPKILSKSMFLFFPLCTSNNAPTIPIIDLIILLTSSNHWLFGLVNLIGAWVAVKANHYPSIACKGVLDLDQTAPIAQW